MMKKLTQALLAAGLISSGFVSLAHAADAAPASPHTFTGNMTLTTDYRFRGISQTYKLPAVQGGIDYSHASGVYLGTWASSVSNNVYPRGSGLEWDFYGGYKFEPVKNVTLDVGLLYYWYPGAKFLNADAAAQLGNGNGTFGDDGETKPNNLEWYVGVSYKYATLKYNRTTTDWFGTRTQTQGANCGLTGTITNRAANSFTTGCNAANPGGSKGSGYLDLTVNYPLTEKLTLNAHVGHQTVKNYSNLSYSDYKLGLTYDLNGWALSAAYIDTNAKEQFYRYSDDASGTNTAVTKVKDLSDGSLVVSVSKSF